MEIKFDLDINSFKELANFEPNEINTIAKRLFVEWYGKTYNQTQTNTIDIDVINSRLSSQLTTTMSTFMGSLNSNLEQINTTTKELYGISKSNKKGGVFEDAIEEIFKKNFQDYTYTNTSTQPHHGDGLLESPSGLQAIIEMKNYTHTINSDQITKLKYDLKHTGVRWGLMLSTNSSIQGRKSVDIEIFDQDGTEYCIVYISHLYGEPHKINTGIALLEHLYLSSTKSGLKPNSQLHLTKLHELIETDLSQLSELIDTFAQLKTRYLNMEKIFRDQLDGFYLHLRDTEINLKHSIEKIWKRIDIKFEILNSETSEQVIDKLSTYKGVSLLTRIYDEIFIPNNIVLICSPNSGEAQMYYFNKQIGVVKMVSKRVDIQFEILDIKLSITDTNILINVKLIKTIIKDIKLKIT